MRNKLLIGIPVLAMFIALMVPVVRATSEITIGDVCLITIAVIMFVLAGNAKRRPLR